MFMAKKYVGSVRKATKKYQMVINVRLPLTVRVGGVKEELQSVVMGGVEPKGNL